MAAVSLGFLGSLLVSFTILVLSSVTEVSTTQNLISSAQHRSQQLGSQANPGSDPEHVSPSFKQTREDALLGSSYSSHSNNSSHAPENVVLLNDRDMSGGRSVPAKRDTRVPGLPNFEKQIQERPVAQSSEQGDSFQIHWDTPSRRGHRVPHDSTTRNSVVRKYHLDPPNKNNNIGVAHNPRASNLEGKFQWRETETLAFNMQITL